MRVGADVFLSSVWKAEFDMFPHQSWKTFWIKRGVVGLADESIIISRLKACDKYYWSLLVLYPRYYAVFVTKILYKENENNCFQFIRILWKYEYNVKLSWNPPPPPPNEAPRVTNGHRHNLMKRMLWDIWRKLLLSSKHSTVLSVNSTITLIVDKFLF